MLRCCLLKESAVFFFWFCSGFALVCPEESLLSLGLLISFVFGKFNFSVFLFNPNPRELVLIFEHLHRVRNGGFRNSEVKKLPDGAPPPYHSFTPAQKSVGPAACSGER